MVRIVKTLLRYSGISLGLIFMLLSGCVMLYAVFMLINGLLSLNLLKLIQTFLIFVVSLVGVSIGFRVFEYFGEIF